MYRYYIEFFYDKDNKETCLIHEDNKVRKVTNVNNINKIIELCNKYHVNVDEQGLVTRRVRKIIEDYNKYQKKKKRKVIIHNLPKVPFVLAKAYPKATAIILSISIAGGVAGALSNNNEEVIIDNEPAITQEIDEEYISRNDITYQKNIDEMLKENANTFHFSYKDRSHEENVINAKRYEDLFVEYGNRYGIDPNLLIALASQESNGDHYSNLNNGPACGIMQIERSAHLGTTITAYNVETNDYDSISVTEENLNDLEKNIQIGTMILQNCLKEKNYNIPLALQTYNFGPGNISDVLHMCSDLENISIDSMINDPTNNEWMNYRSYLGVGDPEYVEHVFSFLNPEENLKITTQNKIITLNIQNDYIKTKEV